MFGDPVANPRGWPTAKVGTLCARVTVGIVVKPASYYQPNGVPAIRGTNIKLEGIDLADAVFFSEEDNSTRLGKTRVWEGDVLVVRSGRPGLAAVVPKKLSGCNSIDVLIATPNQDRIRPVFLRDFLNSATGRRLILAESKGQIQQHFNVGSLSDAEIYVPPIKLQDAYVARLAAIESVNTKQAGSMSKLNSLFASLQNQAFGERVEPTFPNLPDTVPVNAAAE
jgi:type I restriction enzyme S subunit